MIHLSNIFLSFGGQVILEDLTWHIKADRRIGLIGANGAGKSTLLKLIAGEIKADSGRISRASDTTLGYLHQDVQEMDVSRSVFEEAMTAFDDVQGLENEVIEVTAELEEDSDHESDRYQKLLHRLERLHTDLQAQESHLIEPECRSVISGLGFADEEIDRPLSTFSGGWRMRATLARMLLRRPDVLLLDEPTNHLDIDSIDWLESYLGSYKGSVVIVSHDRYFLDRMVGVTAELDRGRITEYAGNYSFYLEEREERREQQRAAFENQQREIAEIERFIERFRYKATKAKQVQSRIKMLERMERIPEPRTAETSIHFRFPPPRRSGKVVLEMSRFSKTYRIAGGGTNDVFRDAGPLQVERGDKIALIGKNGAGKSTLARMCLGTEAFDGTRGLGHNVELTYFAQHQADTLKPDQTVIEALQTHAHGQNDTQIRSLLGAFLFSGDDVFKSVSVLSGGERNRVALARTLLAPANFMILDEPTNHLDIQSIGVLVEALRQYSGTFIVVSHDRHFLDHVATKVWHVGGGTVRAYPGTCSEYRWTLRKSDIGREGNKQDQTTGRNTTSEPEDDKGKSRSRKEIRRAEAEKRRRRYQKARKEGDSKKVLAYVSTYKLEGMLSDLEASISTLEEEKEALEERLMQPDFFKDAEASKSALDRFHRLEDELPKHYDQWEAVASERERRT